MTVQNLSRRAFLGTSVLAATAVLGGCGAYKTDSAGSAEKSDVKQIDFCLDYTPNTNHTGIYVAQKKGWFNDEGLEVNIIQPADDTADTLIGSGQAQLGVSYQDYIANALASENPLPITAVAAIIQHNTSGIMSRKADGIVDAKDMENHTYATWDMPVEQATIKQVMEADGGDFSKLKMVPYTVDDDVAGLKANLYDCVWVYEGWAVQNAAVQDYPVNYFSFISMDPVFDFYTPVIAANDTFCSEHPKAVKAFLRAAKKGYEFCIKNPKEAAAILCEEVPELDSALVEKSQNFLAGQYQADAPYWGQIDKKRWATYFEWLKKNKLVSDKLGTDAGWTMDYLEA